MDRPEIRYADKEAEVRKMRPCVYYHENGYSLNTNHLMGRQAAGESFLQGFIKYSSGGEIFSVKVDDPHQLQKFEEQIKSVRPDAEASVITMQNLEGLRNSGCLYLPGPGLALEAQQRAIFGHSEWSLCGITHTTSSARAMDLITECITEPLQEWDALICTSLAVKQNVEFLLQSRVDYLKDRLGITKITMPKLPVIPLGINTQQFTFTSKERSTARDKYNIPDDAVVILYLGRISFHAKAHPLPMYQAISNSSLKTKREIVLVECGWFGNEYIERAFDDGFSAICPSTRRTKYICHCPSFVSQIFDAPVDFYSSR